MSHWFDFVFLGVLGLWFVAYTMKLLPKFWRERSRENIRRIVGCVFIWMLWSAATLYAADELRLERLTLR